MGDSFVSEGVSLEDLSCYSGQFHTHVHRHSKNWTVDHQKKKGIKMKGDYVEGKIRVEGENREWILLEHGQKNDSW